uniref:Uncharacterized protein n=1 Tax=Arundo donax TaxID=35708 RepID=A0A0A9F3V4_ARUDO
MIICFLLPQGLQTVHMVYFVSKSSFFRYESIIGSNTFCVIFIKFDVQISNTLWKYTVNIKVFLSVSYLGLHIVS